MSQLVAIGSEEVKEAMEFKRCSDCPALLLDRGNQAAWEVYARCWNQVITIGMDAMPLGVEIGAVYRVMETLNVPKELQLDVVDKVNLIHSIIFPVKKKEGEQ